MSRYFLNQANVPFLYLYLYLFLFFSFQILFESGVSVSRNAAINLVNLTWFTALSVLELGEFSFRFQWVTARSGRLLYFLYCFVVLCCKFNSYEVHRFTRSLSDLSDFTLVIYYYWYLTIYFRFNLYYFLNF